MDLAALRVEVATLACEIATVEFKSGVNVDEPRFWVQLVRGVAGMHNSGGGLIVFGLDSQGNPVEGDLTPVRAIDPIDVSNKFKHYTECALPGVRRDEFEKAGARYPGWVIPGALVPVPFTRPGDVHTGQGKPEKLFYPGQIVVRRGASTVAADANDMALIADRIRIAARKEFWEQMGQVVVLAQGHTVHGIPPGAVISTAAAPGAVRITTNADDPTALVVDKYKTHPHRQTEMIKRLATRIPAARANGHDIGCIRKVYSSEIESKGYVWVPPRSSAQYAEDFVDWIAGKVESDPAFLSKTRAACKRGVRA